MDQDDLGEGLLCTSARRFGTLHRRKTNLKYERFGKEIGIGCTKDDAAKMTMTDLKRHVRHARTQEEKAWRIIQVCQGEEAGTGSLTGTGKGDWGKMGIVAPVVRFRGASSKRVSA